MAKKQQETGPGTGMIIALVFFVLTSVILGVTTYLGFDGQGELEKKAAEADKKEKAAKAQADEQTTRRNMLRVLTGIEEPTDREDLNGAARAQKDAILDEYKRITDKLGRAAFPRGSALQWPLISDLQKGDGPSGPATGPNKTLPQIAKEWERLADDAETRFRTEKAAHQQTLALKVAADKRAEEQKATFDKQVEELTTRITAKIADMDKAFLALKTEADKAGTGFRTKADDWAKSKVELDDRLNSLKAELEVERARYQRMMNSDSSDLLARIEKLDFAKLAESMGTVREKTGTFVTIEFKRRIALVPGQTFVVVAPGSSLSEVMEREKELETKHNRVTSLDAREPFTDNERVKGMVEITDVTGANTARARITYEAQPIRNPIARQDQTFNIALSSGDRERVAFAGIIDLDGDGRPDTDAFMSVLQKNNMRVDAHLDLRSGEIKGRMEFGTRLLILGTDVPLVGNVKKMVDDARAKNIAIMDAKKFLNLVGVKTPRNAAPPEYTRVSLGGEGALAPKDPDAPPPPVADPKGAEPKKDEGKKE